MPRHDDADTLLDAEALRLSAGRFVRHVRGTVEQMPAGQASVLGHLDRDGQLAITELADRERVRHQSMARTVKLLAEQGLVDLAPDSVDRRRVLVGITGAGRAGLEHQRHDRSSVIADAIRGLPADQRALLRQVPALLDALTERVREGS